MAATPVVRLGRYTLERRLAVGGMAEVFLARFDGPEQFKKRVVVKRILEWLSEDAQIVTMFLDEARLAARFNHPNLVQVYELSRIEGHYCLVMEYLEGQDVGQLLDRCDEVGDPLPHDIAIYIAIRALEGLDYAHRLRREDGKPLQIVHRDISPTNLLVTWNGDVKVVDFGVASYAGSQSSEDEGLKGKVCYMSPEQAGRAEVDGRSDVFSVGLVLYELLTLESFFAAEDPQTVLLKVAGLADVSSRIDRPDVPAALRGVLHRMLAPSPADRYASASEAARDLDRLMSTRLMANDVATYLQTLFGDERASVATRVRSATMHYDAQPVQGELENPGLRLDQTMPLPSVVRTPTPRRRVLRRRRVTGALTAAAAGVALWLMFATRLPLAPGGAARAEVDEAPKVPLTGDVAPREAPAPPASVPTPPPERPVSRPKPRPKPAPREPAGNGTVAFDVRPWADVYLRGKKIGTTPMAPYTLAEGEQSFTLVNPQTHVTRTVTIKVRVNQTVKLEASLE